MAYIPDRYVRFGNDIMALDSFKVVLLYLSFVAISPLWRKLAPQMSLKKVMLLHNVICVIMSLASLLLLCYGLFDCGCFFQMKYNEFVKTGMFIYLLSKYVELLDTVFMILRHKQRQITFLHVYHHSTILLLGDYSHKAAPWPPIGAMIGLNSMVHVFLYAYYAYTSATSSVSMSWKKKLTQLQIIQFLLGLMECTSGYLYHGFCIYGIFYGFSMLLLFSNFYYKAYIFKRDNTKKE